jgi:prefoldin subunit 5
MEKMELLNETMFTLERNNLDITMTKNTIKKGKSLDNFKNESF